jgi:xanthine dehydrogenase large subunit
MGGGFGGKESQAAQFAAMAALAAHKLKKPARIILTKDEDMKTTGKRHPFKNFYEVGFDQDGRILALKVHLYSMLELIVIFLHQLWKGPCFT